MIRDPLLKLVSIAVVLVAVLGAGVPAQNTTAGDDAVPMVFEHRFGGDTPDHLGFLVEFYRPGAGVAYVKLLDQRAGEQGKDPDAPYTLVFEEKSQPSVPDSATRLWLQVREQSLGDYFPALAAQNGLAVAVWDVAERSPNVVRFTLDAGNGITFEKTFRYEEGHRDLILELAMHAAPDRAAQDVGARWNFELDGFGLYSPRSDYVLGKNVSMGVGSIIGADGSESLVAEHAPGKALPKPIDLAQQSEGAFIDFAGSTNRFFGGFLYPEDQDRASKEALVGAIMLTAPVREQLDIPANSVPVAKYSLSMPVPAAGAETRVRYRIYLGPKSFDTFDEQPEYARFDPVLKKALEPMCCSVPGTTTLAIFLMWLLGVLHGVVGNWGVAIICLTILVRGSLVPLNFRMQKSMRAYGTKMAKLKPKLDEIQKKYANDKQQLQQAMMAFQREHKMFPPLGGCLPMFITIPIFIGLYTALRVSYDLRLQPFAFWIHDLSHPDRLFHLGWSMVPDFNLLPLIMIVMWWWLQHGTPLPKDPQQRQVMKIMRFMPLVFGVMLYQYASALMVYMITSSCFGLIEQRVTRRILGPVDPDAAGMAATPMI